MRIRIDTGKANMASSDLLGVSRSMRRLREEVEAVRRRLRQQSQLDGCRAELLKQEESLSLLTARLVNMSTALSQISDVYNMAERKNVDRVEEQDSPRRGVTDAAIYSIGNQYREKINQMLYK